MPPQIALLKITSPQIILDLYENKHVVQDMLVPISNLKESLECFDVKSKVGLEFDNLVVKIQVINTCNSVTTNVPIT